MADSSLLPLRDAFPDLDEIADYFDEKVPVPILVALVETAEQMAREHAHHDSLNPCHGCALLSKLTVAVEQTYPEHRV